MLNMDIGDWLILLVAFSSLIAGTRYVIQKEVRTISGLYGSRTVLSGIPAVFLGFITISVTPLLAVNAIWLSDDEQIIGHPFSLVYIAGFFVIGWVISIILKFVVQD